MVPEIRHVAGLAEHVHVLFNTNYEDQGQVRGPLMRQLLGQTAGKASPTAGRGTPDR